MEFLTISGSCHVKRAIRVVGKLEVQVAKRNAGIARWAKIRNRQRMVVTLNDLETAHEDCVVESAR